MVRDYKKLFAILKAIGLTKEEAVMDFTEGKSDSLKSLNDGEFKEFMIRLRRLQPAPKKWQPSPGDGQRKKMIGLAKSMHWGRDTLEVIARLDEWCLKQKYHKRLNDLSVMELGTLLTIFEHKVYTGYLKGIKN